MAVASISLPQKFGVKLRKTAEEAGYLPEEFGVELSALAVKRIGAKKGLKLEEHGGLWSFVNVLAMQSGDKDLTTFFHVANSLHRNFYEDEMKRETVEIAAENIEKLVDKLREILS